MRQKKYFSGEEYVLITGGAGFIGTNLADRLLSSGEKVLLFDNLSREGVINNFYWLADRHGDNVQLLKKDIRDVAALEEAVLGASSIFHFAAQVAITHSLIKPQHDFEVNVVGTIHLLEVLRRSLRKVPMIFTSTNKVYGRLRDVSIFRNKERYEQSGLLEGNGIDEHQALDFISLYGCSKGAADQYVLEYARAFHLPATVFRMSCIYGPHQCGNEDQGWVTHFFRCLIEREPITIYGDGCQVRDILFIDDLVDAFILAREQIDRLQGHAYNMGGGINNTLSLCEYLTFLEALFHYKPTIKSEPWRNGDQRYYVTNYSKFQNQTAWSPQYSMKEGLDRLHRWLLGARYLPTSLLLAS